MPTIAVQSPVSTIPCKILNILIKVCYSLPCLLTLILDRPLPPAPSISGDLVREIPAQPESAKPCRRVGRPPTLACSHALSVYLIQAHLLSNAYALIHTTATIHLLPFQSLPHSLYRDGGCTPFFPFPLHRYLVPSYIPLSKPFTCNTYESPRKCCKQKTYDLSQISTKPCRCNTYKKHGVGGGTTVAFPKDNFKCCPLAGTFFTSLPH